MHWFKRRGKVRLEKYRRSWDFENGRWPAWLDENAELTWVLIGLTCGAVLAAHVVFN